MKKNITAIHLCFMLLLGTSVSLAQNVSEDNNQPQTIAKDSKVKNTLDAGKGTKPARPTLTVSVSYPEYQKNIVTLAATGTIEARQMADIVSQTVGLSLMGIHADVGDWVEKGQLLAEYDAASVRNDIAQAKANVAAAQVTYEQAASNNKRAERLRKTKAISAIEIDNFYFQKQQAMAQLASAKAILKNQELRADYAQVRAKVSGLITDKKAVLGEVGNPGTPLFSLIVNNEREWQADVPSDQLHNIKLNTPVRIWLEDYTGARGKQTSDAINGKVRKISPIINQQTRLGKVYVSLDKEHQLRKGQFIQGDFILGQQTVLTIPITSLIRKDGYNYVFVVDDNNIIHRKKINIGPFNTSVGEVNVLSGVTQSERIVSDGVGFLNDGDTVKIAAKKPTVSDSKAVPIQPKNAN